MVNLEHGMGVIGMQQPWNIVKGKTLQKSTTTTLDYIYKCTKVIDEEYY